MSIPPLPRKNPTEPEDCASPGHADGRRASKGAGAGASSCGDPGRALGLGSTIHRAEPFIAVVAPLVVSLGAISWLYVDNNDARITGLFYDVSGGQWPWRGRWLTMTLLHDGGTKLVALAAFLALLVAIFGGRRGQQLNWRRAGLFVLLSIAIPALIVGRLKAISPDPSPWFAIPFGGEFTHGPFFTSTHPRGELGMASPGAFATGGFAMMSLYFVFRRRSRRVAWSWLVAGWTMGSLFGALQVVRGAHYPSHNYWSAIVVWTFCVALYWGPFRGRALVR